MTSSLKFRPSLKKRITTTALVAVALASSTVVRAQTVTKYGTNAGASVTTGIYDTAIGQSALQFATDGSYNTALGAIALKANVVGRRNTAIGYGTLTVSVASDGTAVGFDALFSNTSGSINTAVGNYALYTNTTGANNVAVGHSALYSNVGASFNTAIGVEALRLNTGASNVAVGYQALYKNTTGNFNVAVGDGALMNLTTGSGNIAVGEDAGFVLTTGSNNIRIGNKTDGVLGENNIIRIGNLTHTDTYLAGVIRGNGSGLTGITAASLVANSVTGTQIAAGAVTGAKIASATISGANLASGLTLGGTTTGTFSGSLAGNATSATTAVSFTGPLAGNVTGTQGATVVSTVGGVTAANIAAGANLANAATSQNLANTIVRRDANGNFSGGTFTGTVAGNVSVLQSSVVGNGLGLIEFVPVGNPGNANDTADGDSLTAGVQRFGAVASAFQIGKYEVTNAQYVKFLNAVAVSDPNALYNPFMTSSTLGGISRSGASGSYSYTVKKAMGNKPVNYVRFYSAIRFCNWLHNGMPSGAQGAATTEDGAYGITAGPTVSARKAGAKFFLPNENEWYKAAYYDPNKGGVGVAGYWLYPTQSDSLPDEAHCSGIGDIDTPTMNIANFNQGSFWNDVLGNVTTVGSGGPGSESAYGAADMAGNVYEWNEAIVSAPKRGLRGGAWNFGGAFLLSSNRDFEDPAGGANAGYDNIGFRVAKP
jgi:formylglycine-generating enzyme required for sulfatase activity